MLGSAALMALMGMAQAAPVDLITNGDFETGTLAGWTMNTTGGEAECGRGFFVIPNGGLGPISLHPTEVLAGGGTFVAMSDQCGPGGQEIRQTFTVAPGLASLILDFDWFNNTHFAYTGDTGAIDGSEQHGRIDILSAGAASLDVGAGVVMTLRLDAGTETPLGGVIPWVHETINLTGLAPGNYELRFGSGECCLEQELGVDNVQLMATVPTPAPLALLGAGLLGLALMRRRLRA